ncbi:MAG: hypothetical protein IPM29_32640 [Planctomycetes bacterium]|nr:hypothetical protein [Planctomycetota bacterium]
MIDGGTSSGRDERGRFAPGNPGGPGGSRPRAFALRRAVEEAVTEEHVAAMIRRATRMGLEGNLAAMRFVLERVCGRVADAPTEAEPVDVELPPMRTAADCNVAMQRIIDGLVQGTVDRDTAAVVVDAIQTRLKSIEIMDLESRIARLERDDGGRCA